MRLGMQKFLPPRARCKLKKNTSHPVGKVRTPNTCTTERCVYTLKMALLPKNIVFVCWSIGFLGSRNHTGRDILLVFSLRTKVFVFNIGMNTYCGYIASTVTSSYMFIVFINLSMYMQQFETFSMVNAYFISIV